MTTIHFSEPVLDETSVVFEPLYEKGKEGLVLQGLQSQIFHDSNRCWTFVRTVADFTLETTTGIVTETANEIHLVTVDGSIRFPNLKTHPVEAGSIVTIKRTPEHVFVCQDLTQTPGSKKIEFDRYESENPADVAYQRIFIIVDDLW